MKRILITGSSGAGKTTLAKSIASHLDIPLIHLDKYFWEPNWGRPNMDQWRRTVGSLVKADSWVIEGNYGSTFDIRFPRATTLIHFDYPSYKCLYRCIKRKLLTGAKVREDMAKGL